MLVKALRPIAAGEEIYLNYISYSTMLTRSARICNWFPICTCSDCQQDRMAPPGALKKREKLMNISVTVLQDNGKLTELYQAIKFLQNSIEELKTTFTKQQLNSGTPYELAVLYDQEAEVRASIGRQIGSQDQLKKAILLRKKALEGYGVQLDQAAWKLKHGSNLPVVTLPLRNFESIVDHCHCLKRLYESLGPSKAEQTAWVKAAEWISDGILAPGLYKLMHQ